ncbi:MAG: hypothetical protein XU08_C0003G0081 [candidate division WWE3 bacterium CSP1-7]|jgi:hypothetical protein|uniref:Uncharacterized protein n=1 Tax=candidate division WWE3 bacterium CSP1-7 TaxID=1576480 RepID=A0A0T5ZX83_UNCKA|nr:MAG: hypothetical protein XU08_C0003G0081 [candidate division WWE3 bacterium CSP1-7]
MRNALAVLIMVILIIGLAVYELLKNLYFYGNMGVATLVLFATSKRR